MKDVKNNDHTNSPNCKDKTKVVCSNTENNNSGSVNRFKNKTSSSDNAQEDKLNTPEIDCSTLIGTTIKNRYIIESILGYGGLCDVYLAKDKLLESSGSNSPYVALKILQREFATQPETARMLIREAQQTQRLSHPNIVRMFDFGVDGEQYFLVMEHIDGETLEDLIQRSRPNGLKFNAALSILNQVFDAISYSHSLGIVHADLKPSNIILTSDGIAKILDFGVSKTHKIKQDQYAAKLNSDNKLMLGYTPNYASLNLLSGKGPTLGDDIFALICITYELLSCKHPYARTPVDEALRNKVRVRKPVNLPMTKWPLLESVLTIGLVKNDLNVNRLKQKLNQRIWTLISGIAAGLLLTTSTGFIYYQQNIKIERLKTEISSKNNLIYSSELLLNTPPEDSRAIIDSQDDLHPVLRAGLLHLHKPFILKAFESQIDDVLNSQATLYPDYHEIESILLKAKHYYPDSHKIEVLALDIHSSKQSTLLSISKRINSHLEKAHYTKSEDDKSVYELKDELDQIHQGYPFVPSSLANEVFGNHLSLAVKNRDAAALVTLIKAGNTFFPNVEVHKANLAKSNSMKDAILEMKLYDGAVNSSNPLTFPVNAARTLFQEEFDILHSRLEQAKTTTQLDRLVSDIEEFSDNFPLGFEDINDLRFKTADKYLKFSDILLNKRKASSARNAIQKANDLMRQIEQASTQT